MEIAKSRPPIARATTFHMHVVVDMVAAPPGGKDFIVLSPAPWNECMSVLFLVIFLFLIAIYHSYQIKKSRAITNKARLGRVASEATAKLQGPWTWV
jgi:hypothetical protein